MECWEQGTGNGGEFIILLVGKQWIVSTDICILFWFGLKILFRDG